MTETTDAPRSRNDALAHLARLTRRAAATLADIAAEREVAIEVRDFVRDACAVADANGVDSPIVTKAELLLTRAQARHERAERSHATNREALEALQDAEPGQAVHCTACGWQAATVGAGGTICRVCGYRSAAWSVRF